MSKKTNSHLQAQLSALTVNIVDNGSYTGQVGTSDTANVSGSLALTLQNFEHINLGAFDFVTLNGGPDTGNVIYLTFGGAADFSSYDFVTLGSSQNYNLSLYGQGGFIMGVAGSSLNIVSEQHSPYGAFGLGGGFQTDGSIGSITSTNESVEILFNNLHGDSVVDLHGGKGELSFIYQSTYSIGANGDVIVAENGYTVTVHNNAKETLVFHDAHGEVFTYAELIGVIAGHDGSYVG
jgi:hypothetical protein